MNNQLDNPMPIIEGVVTTLDSDGKVNIAPMGPMVSDDFKRFVFRPFVSSTTYKNLKQSGQGVFHITDDALLIARGAIGKIDPESVDLAPTTQIRGLYLTSACRYYEFKVASLDDANERTRIDAEVVHVGQLRDFAGFNRAKHAVVEAAILATRVHLTGSKTVLEKYDELIIPVRKTGGPDEQQAMIELRNYVEQSPMVHNKADANKAN